MSSIGVTAGSTEYRENWPPYSVFRKVELIPSQDSNAREARCKAKDLKTGERDTEPAEADERGGGSEDQIRLLIEGHGRVRLGLRHALFFISAISIRTCDVYQNNALEGGHGLNR